MQPSCSILLQTNPGGGFERYYQKEKMYDEKSVCICCPDFLGAVPFVSLAQSPSSPEQSIEQLIENLNVAAIPEDSIVVLSQEESGAPGYVHEKYAFYCLGELRLVDYYGSAFDPKDQTVLEFERELCSRQKFNDYDTE